MIYEYLNMGQAGKMCHKFFDWAFSSLYILYKSQKSILQTVEPNLCVWKIEYIHCLKIEYFYCEE